MYDITVEQDFDAAHFLKGYSGKCERLHGHRFRVAATMRFHKLNDIGLSYDFSDLKRHLRDVLGRLDHQPLNDTPPFDSINPSSENIARTIYEELLAKLGEQGNALRMVEVWESPEAKVAYAPDLADGLRGEVPY